MGRPFNAVLKLNEENKAGFDFGPESTNGNGTAQEVDFSGQQPVGKCPKCSEETLFSNRGVMTKRQLEAVKRLFKRTCKDLPEP